MAYKTLNFRITGASPLLQHNGRLANPTTRFAKDIKKISGKRNKTDADYEELARLEWFGSLYLDDGAPCITGEAIEACIIRGAVTKKKGKLAKAGAFCLKNSRLEYDGPRDPMELWEREEFRFMACVKVGSSRVVRTRHIFPEWAAEVEVQYNPAHLNADEVREFLTVAGELEGIGDWRPRFGRFEVQQV